MGHTQPHTATLGDSHCVTMSSGVATPGGAGGGTGGEAGATKRSLEEEPAGAGSSKAAETPPSGTVKRPKQDLSGLPTRQDLASLARERPRDPIEYLAGYLLRHKREFDPEP